MPSLPAVGAVDLPRVDIFEFLLSTSQGRAVQILVKMDVKAAIHEDFLKLSHSNTHIGSATTDFLSCACVT